MKTENNEIVCAVDIGGTKTLIGLISKKGEVICKKRFETNITENPYDHLNKCIEYIKCCCDECNVKEQSINGIGVSVPGLTDSSNGILLKAPYAGWINVNIRDYFSSFYPSKIIKVANDVNACASGELVFGEGRKYSSFIWVTISTGIGAGLVINGQIYEGEFGIAGELGHTIVEWEHGLKCTCGNIGCFEACASGNAIAKYAKEICLENNNCQLKRYFYDENLEITAESVARAARSGIIEGREIYDRVAKYAGRALSYAVNIINPGCIFIGGGVGLSFDLLETGIRRVIQNSVICQSNKIIPITKTKLGYDASLIGAASLLFGPD